MRITYASAHRWVKNVSEGPMQGFGGNSRARLLATLPRVSTTGVRSEIRPLNDGFLDVFIPRYEARILEKQHPTVFDIRKKTLGSPSRAHRYYSLALFEGDLLVGGMIFSVWRTRVSIAYRVFEHAWRTAPLQAKPSLYAEYLIAEHARSLGIETIIHGKDRNPYGMNSSIGLAVFKLSVGCHPEKSRQLEVRSLDTDAVTEDVLVLEYPGDVEERITKGYLITTPESEHQWKQVLKYPDRLLVEVLYRKNTAR